MTNKEKAELLNGILNYLNKAVGLTDMRGYLDIKNQIVKNALIGLEREGYVDCTIPEDSDDILFVSITDYGKRFIEKSKFV